MTTSRVKSDGKAARELLLHVFSCGRPDPVGDKAVRFVDAGRGRFRTTAGKAFDGNTAEALERVDLVEFDRAGDRLRLTAAGAARCDEILGASS